MTTLTTLSLCDYCDWVPKLPKAAQSIVWSGRPGSLDGEVVVARLGTGRVWRCPSTPLTRRMRCVQCVRHWERVQSWKQCLEPLLLRRSGGCCDVMMWPKSWILHATKMLQKCYKNATKMLQETCIDFPRFAEASSQSRPAFGLPSCHEANGRTAWQAWLTLWEVRQCG